jgi:hypothetical protein
MRMLMGLAVAAACGSVEGKMKDAAVESDVLAVDAYVPTCAAGSFTTSSPVMQLNSTSDDTFLRLSPDELTAYFTRNTGTPGTYIATRGSTTSPFGTPAPMNNGVDMESPTVTADGLTMYFVSARTGTSGMRDVWKATRATTTADFANVTNVTELNSTAEEHDVYVLPDHSAIYVSSARNGGVHEIFRAARNGSGFNAPMLVFSLTPGFVNRVVVAPDERTMAYQAGNDIYLTTRSSTSDAWTAGNSQTPLNTVNADNPTWISSDLCRLYFQTNRVGTQGLDFHVTVRSPQ